MEINVECICFKCKKLIDLIDGDPFINSQDKALCYNCGKNEINLNRKDIKVADNSIIE